MKDEYELANAYLYFTASNLPSNAKSINNSNAVRITTTYIVNICK